MATNVSQIITAMNAINLSELGASWQELRDVFDVSRNDLRAGYLGYGVRPLDAINALTVTRAYMLEHRFETILCSTIGRGPFSSAVITVLGTLYNYMDEIYKEYENTKLNLSSIVALVSEPSLSEPEVIQSAELVVLRMQIKVKYKNLLSS